MTKQHPSTRTQRLLTQILSRFLLAAACSFPLAAFSDIMITPTRLVMDEKNRTAEVTLLNTKKETKVYRIFLSEKIQNAAGGYNDIDTKEGEFIASPMLRYSPKKVSIEPGGYQRIKLSYRMPANLEDGEYRSHLAMKLIDSGVELSDYKQAPENATGMSMTIVPVLSFSIPVIVRKGKIDIDTNINNPDLSTTDGKKALAVTLHKKGIYSSFGSVHVYMKANAISDVVKIGEITNIAVYRESNSRTVHIPLTTDNIPSGATLQVIYEGDDEYEGTQWGSASFTYQQ